MANQEAMDALMRIEGFRSLNQDIETIINKSEAVKKAKKKNRETHSAKRNVRSFQRKKRNLRVCASKFKRS